MLPNLDTARLHLRPRGMADLESCLTMDRDPQVTRFIPGPWADPIRHRAFVTERISADYCPGLGYWSIFHRHRPSDFLGWVLLIPEDMTGPEVEIGWRLTRSARGQGIATEAARAVAEHGLKVFGLSHIIARIDPGNIASVKVAERIGMRLSAAGPKENLYHLTRADLAPPRMS
ncbi:GNAT family N-acetyltransferase [Paracoccus albus]|uniref:GNAT family N-acetyltransferase n=1 Tax=Paracoccus albus TaxID=3017784 RepID=UPI0022F06E6A|nr:GNAT family N-acetyltransferase [Paracoccus albus]WBU60260.1 GNAT family N-acetyltransferase [Paracoccus albus]